jgi:hypothetical protein
MAEHDAVARALESARAGPVGPAVSERLEHAGHRAIVGRVPRQRHPTGYSAHGMSDRMNEID